MSDGRNEPPDDIVIDLSRKPTEPSGSARNPMIARLAVALAVIVVVPAVVLGVQYLGRDRARPTTLPTATPGPSVTDTGQADDRAVDLPLLAPTQANFWDPITATS